MGITRLSSLFAANIDPVPAVPRTHEVSPHETAAQRSEPVSSDAVVVSKTLQSANRSPVADADVAHAARLQKLTESVRSGTYTADREKVAISLLRDLA
jgi:anti-sigma28 factor (negative regulator of flagellin synthesis)